MHSAVDLNCGARCEGKLTRGYGRDRASDILGSAPAVDGSKAFLKQATPVIGVWIRPGRTSYTAIPSAARRIANSFAIMATAALDIAYSPRSGLR